MKGRHNSTIRNLGTCGALGILMVASAACAEVTSTEPAPARSAHASFAKAPQTSVCHATGGGSYLLLSINGNAVDAHRSHGDALPGEPVPGMAGYAFGSDCVPELIATDLNGEWAGTYTWNCGGTRTGSSAIRFMLSDPGTGRISGTVSYLGGSSVLAPFETYRIGQPILRPNGTWLGGSMDPEGMYVRLTTHGDPGFFVNNQFDGLIASDFRSISGNTMNGDSPTPGSAGCSAGVGYSGTFTVVRVS